MSSKFIVFYGIIQSIVIIITVANCSELNNSNEWKTIQVISGRPKSPEVALKKVEWDDDDFLTNELHQQDKKEKRLTITTTTTTTTTTTRKPSQRKSANKLIYHGQLYKKNIQVVDGIRLSIDTHEPSTISRKNIDQEKKLTVDEDNLFHDKWLVSKIREDIKEDDSKVKLGKIQELLSSSDWKPITVSLNDSNNNGNRRSTNRLNRRELSRQRTNNTRFESETEVAKAPPISKSLVIEKDAFQWKPVKISKESSFQSNKIKLPSFNSIKDKKQQIVTVAKESPFKGGNSNKTSTAIDSKTVVVYGKQSSTINEPFDDDIITKEALHFQPEMQVKQREAKAITALNISNQSQWIPVANTNDSAAIDLIATTTTELPFNASANESAHRSASDLNYIYSSQPNDAMQQRQSISSASSNYYSNYVIQPQTVEMPLIGQNMDNQQPQQLITPIIDSTSGQLPEMVAERVPTSQEQQPQQASNDYYSIPQAVSSNNFQPSIPLPGRAAQPQMPTYNDNYNSYSYNAPQPSRNFQPNSYGTRQNSATTTPAPQVVRQEHHYHYYNNQQADRNLNQQSTSTTTQAPIIQQNVIREIQPFLISQPMIQQVTSTSTPAPQIIREIIKEVPAQAYQVQLPRIVIPQQQTVDAYPMNSAQRVIRQLSSSIPTVSVRMPPVLQQIKLPALQALQALHQPLSTRLQGSIQAQQQPQSVTRQTGSFVIPPMPKKTTTFLTETQAMPTHTTIMHTTQFTPATRTTIYTTDHQPALMPPPQIM